MNVVSRQLVHEISAEVWPGVAPRLIEAVVAVESGGDSQAVSPAGAVGLMQLMPGTARDLGVAEELLFDPETNLRAGVRYLREQFEAFPEIPDYDERISFALASYNAGRGWINKALAHARVTCGGLMTEQPGPWQRWEIASAHLHEVRDKSGRRPDVRQVQLYVARVRAVFWLRATAAEED